MSEYLSGENKKLDEHFDLYDILTDIRNLKEIERRSQVSNHGDKSLDQQEDQHN